MSRQSPTDYELALQNDELALHVARIEQSIQQGRFQDAVDLLERYPASSWFGLQTSRTVEILQLLISKPDVDSPLLDIIAGMMTSKTSGHFDSPEVLAQLDTEDSNQMFLLAILRMSDLRIRGYTLDALEQCDAMESHLGSMQPMFDAQDGWELQTAVQIGVSAMLAGDFTRALAAFTRAQIHPPLANYAFLSRDALVQSALIHACFGNETTAKALLQRAEAVQRTSSWVEYHIDEHRDFAHLLLTPVNSDEALARLEAVNLQDIGEMWPFYILTIHRILEAGGHHDELAHRLEIFDSMPFPRQDGDGFAGSIIPLKRAMIAMKTGRGSEAQELLERADPNLPYTQLLQAASHIYAGRTQQAIQQASRLRHDTRGFRLLEIRRLSILAAAQYQAEDTQACSETLKRAAQLPRGLKPAEATLFSPETRELAASQVPSWPTDEGQPSSLLTGLPRPGRAFTDRDVEIVRQLAQSTSRAQMAEKLSISVNTLKTHLASVYRKLEVSSAGDAVLGAQRRGLI